MKYWNWKWDYPLKSYLIQRLVEEIFLKQSMKTWDNTIKSFLKNAINSFDQYFNGQIVLKDRVYTHKSILDDYTEKQLNDFYESLQKANNFAIRNDWTALFGNNY